MSLIDDNQNSPKLEDLIGEGKKYRDPDAVAKAVLEKDAYIQRLEKEAEEARAELRTRLTLEELSDKILSSPKTPIQPTPGNPPAEADLNKNTPDISALVAQELAKTRSAEQTAVNMEKAKAGLKERFGGDYVSALTSVAESLSVNTKFLDGLAAQSPTAFLQLVDSVKPKDDRRPLAPPTSGLDPARGGLPSGVKNNKYYQELRRTDQKLYFSKKVQAELYRNAMEQGSKFYE